MNERSSPQLVTPDHPPVDESTRRVVATVARFREKMLAQTESWLIGYEASGAIPVQDAGAFIRNLEREWNELAYRAAGIDSETRKRALQDVGY